MKTVFEFGPLLLFFGTYFLSGAEQGLFIATGVLIVASIISLTAQRMIYGKVAMMPLISTGLIVVFGGLTIALHDKTFVKIKPTILYTLFAAILVFGLAFGRKLFLKNLMGHAFDMSDTGWQRLTVRWIGFFVLMAVLNEIVWRTYSESTWVSFKVWGALPLTMIFALAQIPLMQRHGFQPKDAEREQTAENSGGADQDAQS